MSEKMININEKVTVVLTTKGFEILNGQINSLNLCDSKASFDAKKRLSDSVSGDRLTLQLWEIMQMFGKDFHMCSEPPFINIIFQEVQDA